MPGRVCHYKMCSRTASVYCEYGRDVKYFLRRYVVTFLLGARASRLRRVYEGKMPLLPGACVTPDVNSYLALLRRRGVFAGVGR